jgi:hypothetical protein
VVKIGIKASAIPKGGALDKKRNIAFALSQVRLICKAKGDKNATSGSGLVVYPDKYKVAGKPLVKSPNLSEVLVFSGEDFKRRKAWIDLAFNVPSDMQASFLAFKNNTIVELPKPVESSSEIERELEAASRDDKKEK